MFSTVLCFPEGRVIVPFLRRRLPVFPRVKAIMNLKRLIVLLDNKHSVIRLYLFCFLLVFCLRGKMTNTISSSLRSFHIYRKWNGRRECKILYEKEGTVYSTCVFLWILWNFQEDVFLEHIRATISEYSRIEFCVNIAQLIILSYPATPRKMFHFKSTHALFYFSSTIDGNTDTVHLIEGFVF